MRLNIGTADTAIGRLKIRRSDPAVFTTVKAVLHDAPELIPVLDVKISKAIAKAKVDFQEVDKELYSGRCPRGSYHGNKVSQKWYYHSKKIDVLTEALNLLRKG